MFKADGKIHEQERDVSKFWKNGEIRISILGIENQTAQDSDIPLRVISYDGAINVFNIAFLSSKTISMFKSDFKIIAEYFRAKRLS